MCGCKSHWSRLALCTCHCPEHVGRRAPRHRADVPVDSCLTLRRLRVAGQCPACSYYEPQHRVGAAS